MSLCNCPDTSVDGGGTGENVTHGMHQGLEDRHEVRRGPLVAFALARKLAVTLQAMWRTNTPFRDAPDASSRDALRVNRPFGRPCRD